ncbi:unnamed protein product [Amoebophrya sp. A25]|nr:unnamed protein product [Amoebophrya sp. A25]|eukprot:GSA25T00015717001.1
MFCLLKLKKESFRESKYQLQEPHRFASNLLHLCNRTRCTDDENLETERLSTVFFLPVKSRAQAQQARSTEVTSSTEVEVSYIS